MNDIRVELAERSYNINFGKTLPVLAPRKTLLVTDSNIYKLYADLLKEMVKPADIFVIPAGEESKNADTFLEAMRCTLILFGSLNMLALFFGVRRARKRSEKA